MAAVWGIFSCSAGGPEQSDNEAKLKIKTPEVEYTAGYGWAQVEAEGDWTLSVEDGKAWASFKSQDEDGEEVYSSSISGTGNKADIILSWGVNVDKTSRTCNLRLLNAGKTSTAVLSQKGMTDEPDKPDPSKLKQDPLASWMELPAVSKNLYFFTHPMTVGGKKNRNYSFAWDLSNLVARWVAYPLNKSLIGSGKRTDKWGIDPKLPESCQPIISFGAFSGFGARGHQIPSADRLNYEQNVETFYGTNMTPQDYDFNGGKWAQLEQYVRDRSARFDTLYVVTGCTVSQDPGYSYDNVGKRVAIPSGYFKALLGYSKSMTAGKTASQGGYTAIGFYYPESKYTQSYQNVSMTIRELENILGIDFFVNLPAAIGSELAEKVETTQDSWWKN